MNDTNFDALIQEALRSMQELPEGLYERLESNIDKWAADEKKRNIFRIKKQTLYWIGGIAATLIVGVAIFFQTDSRYTPPKDTFSDPYEAAIVAQDALAMLSTRLNMGLEQVSEAEERINKINDIVNEQLSTNL